MKLYNINQINLNNKIIKYVDKSSNNTSKNEADLDSKIIVSLSASKNMKQSFSNDIINTIYNHNYLNSVLYFNNLLLSDYYIFNDKYIQIYNTTNTTNNTSFNISNFTYDESTQILKLDSNNTLISCFMLSRYQNRYASISNMTDNDALNEFKYVNIPKTLHFEAQNATGDDTYNLTNSELTYIISNNNIKHYTIINYKNEELKNLETDYSYNYTPPVNESNIISEKLAEYFEPSNQNEKPKLYFTIPTFLNYNYLKREFRHLKFCRLSEIPGIRILYYRQGNDSSGISEHIIDPEAPNEIDYLYLNNINLGNPDKCLIPLDISKIQQTSKNSTTRNINPVTKNLLHKILIKHIQEETSGSPQTLQNKLLTTMTDDEYNRMNIFNESAENLTDTMPVFKINGREYILKPDYIYKIVIEYPSYLHYYFKNYFDTNGNSPTKRRFGYTSTSFININNVVVAYYEEERPVLSFTKNNKLIMINNRVHTQNLESYHTLTHYFVNSPEELTIDNYSNYTHITKVPVIVYEMCYSSIDYQFKLNDSIIDYTTLNENETDILNNQKTISNSPFTDESRYIIWDINTNAANYKSSYGNTYLSIYGNSILHNTVDVSGFKIVAQTVSLNVPGIKSDSTSYPITDNDIISTCNYYSSVSSMFKSMGESGIHLNENRGTTGGYNGPKYAYIFDYNSNNALRNITSVSGVNKNRPDCESRMSLSSIWIKMLLDYPNKLKDSDLFIKRKVDLSKIKLAMKHTNNTASNNYYQQVYDAPFVYKLNNSHPEYCYDDKFTLNNFDNNFYEICYGLEWTEKSENLIKLYYNCKHPDINFKLFGYSDNDNYKLNISSITDQIYSDIVFNNQYPINDIYITDNMCINNDLREIIKHNIILFDFMNCDDIKSITISKNIKRCKILFKTFGLNLIKFNFNNHRQGLNEGEYIIQQIIYENENEEIVGNIENIENEIGNTDYIDKNGYMYFRIILYYNSFN